MHSLFLSSDAGHDRIVEEMSKRLKAQGYNMRQSQDRFTYYISDPIGGSAYSLRKQREGGTWLCLRVTSATPQSRTPQQILDIAEGVRDAD